MVNNLKDIFNSGITKNIDNRLACLHALEESIIFYEQEIFDSLWQDLHKSKEESYIAELSMIYRDIRLFKNNLKKWAKKKKCSTPPNVKSV